MALCLPRSRRAASLATRPSTLSVASITNHSCFTSAGLALKDFMRVFRRKRLCSPRAWKALGAAYGGGLSNERARLQKSLKSPAANGKAEQYNGCGGQADRWSQVARW